MCRWLFLLMQRKVQTNRKVALSFHNNKWITKSRFDPLFFGISMKLKTNDNNFLKKLIQCVSFITKNRPFSPFIKEDQYSFSHSLDFSWLLHTNNITTYLQQPHETIKIYFYNSLTHGSYTFLFENFFPPIYHHEN